MGLTEDGVVSGQTQFELDVTFSHHRTSSSHLARGCTHARGQIVLSVCQPAGVAERSTIHALKSLQEDQSWLRGALEAWGGDWEKTSGSVHILLILN